VAGNDLGRTATEQPTVAQTPATRKELDGVMNPMPAFSPDPPAVGPRPSSSETPWRALALCVGHDPELWFPVNSDGGGNAVRICCACPVRLDCLSWAIAHDERDGIWGGVSARKRQRMRTELPDGGSIGAANPLSSSLRSRDLQAMVGE
jgi:WhiB family redox-sensing transcriptional regulator